MRYHATAVARALRRALFVSPMVLYGIGTDAFADSAPTSTAAPAQTSSNNESHAVDLSTVVVTARKREERGQDVPQSLNVFSGASLKAAGVTSMQQLQFQMPGVAVVSGPGNQISIRGVSNNASPRGGGPSTAVFIDGVYVPNPQMGMDEGEAFDLNRVEVLKGPEGTLYGRNATAGVINYITRDPDKSETFDGFVGGGSYGLREFQGALNFSAGTFADFRVSATGAKDDGYTKNLDPAGGHIDARNYQALRLKGIFHLAPGVEARLAAQHVNSTGTSGYGVQENPDALNYVNSLSPPQRQDPRHIRVDTPPDVHRDGTLVSAQLSADLGNGQTFKSITGYVDYNSRYFYDSDGTGGFIEVVGGRDHSSYWSQEFQFSGNLLENLSWTSGLYFSHESTSGSSLVQDATNYPSDLTPYIFYTDRFAATDRSAAIFGEATYWLSDRWSILAGARYTHETMRGWGEGSNIDFDTFTQVPYFGTESTSSNRFTPKLLLQYQPGENHMFYASVTTGFKSGGINFDPPMGTYRPELITSYELGSKNTYADGAVALDLAGFYYNYRDLQLRTVVGKEAPISNVSKATVKGAEVTFAARPVKGLRFDLNVALVHSSLEHYLSPATDTDLSGMPLPLAPKYSGTAGAEYRFSFGGGSALTARVEVNRQGAIIFPALQNPTVERRGAITLVNANLRFDFPDKHTYIDLIGRNLGNVTYLSNRSYSAGFTDIETFAAPRTVELRIGTKF